MSPSAHDGAVLDTGTKLSVYDNVQIDVGGKLFGKVMERTEGGASQKGKRKK